MTMVEATVADLTGHHLGQRVEVIYEDDNVMVAGALDSVEHRRSFDKHRVMVVLVAGDWRRIEHYDGSQPCRIESAS